MNGIQLKDIPQERIFSLMERLDTRGPRYTSYPTVPVWHNNFSLLPLHRALSKLGDGGEPIAVYMHLPFCRSRCLYCGCNSYISSDYERIGRYAEALLLEVDHIAKNIPKGVRHAQLHLGGGTPTHIEPDLLARILDRIIECIPGTDAAERSIEVDPRVTTEDHLRVLEARNFSRISIGLQDFNPDVQRAIRREYTLEQMLQFMSLARKYGFSSVNIDLIYGLPLQNRVTWQCTLATIAGLKPDRIATFGYAHLPSRIKHQQAIREEDLPNPRERLGMMLDAQRIFSENGYVPIGMDHFALPGDDLAAAQREGRVWRNFMGYTTNRGMELLGVGCSAISEFRDIFVQNAVLPETYAEMIRGGGWAVQRGHELDDDDRIRKQVINHLMCNLDVRIPAEVKELGNGLYDSLAQAIMSLKPYVAEGLLMEHTDGYTITPLGQLFLRNVAMPFDRYLDRQTGAQFSRTV